VAAPVWNGNASEPVEINGAALPNSRRHSRESGNPVPGRRLGVEAKPDCRFRGNDGGFVEGKGESWRPLRRERCVTTLLL
jgi:hypothetical protein